MKGCVQWDSIYNKRVFVLQRDANLGPVVQSIFILIKLLVKALLSLTVLTKLIMLFFLLKNCEVLLHCILRPKR